MALLEDQVGTSNLPINERVRGFCVPRTLQPSPACPLPALARSSFGWSYARWLRCALPVLQVLGSSVKWGLEPHGAAPAPPGRWLLRPVHDASVFREPTRSRRSPPPAKTWVTCWRNGFLRLTLYEIGGPVGLLDGGVELASLSCQLVHPARLRGPTSTAGRIRISARP